MNTGSFIVHVKSRVVYADNTRDVETSFKVLIKNKLGGKIIKDFFALRPNMYSYLSDDIYAYKKEKGTKKCLIK